MNNCLGMGGGREKWFTTGHNETFRSNMFIILSMTTMSKNMKLYTLTMCSLSYIKHTQ